MIVKSSTSRWLFTRISDQVEQRRLGSRSLSTCSVPDDIQVYQYAICPFCNRVKALLDYAGVPYTAIEVNPLTKAEIKWSKDYRKVPIAKVNDEPWFGSDVITSKLLERPYTIARLEHRWGKKSTSASSMNHNTTTMTVQDFAHSTQAQTWIRYATEDLAALLYPNMCRTLTDSYQAFGYIDKLDQQFGVFDRFAIKSLGSLAMYMAANRVKKKRNITDEQAALHQALNLLEQNGLNDNKAFVSGTTQPNLGDIAIYGTLRSIEGLPAHQRFVQDRTGPIPIWYQRMADTIAEGKD